MRLGWFVYNVQQSGKLGRKLEHGKITIAVKLSLFLNLYALQIRSLKNIAIQPS